MGQYYYVANLDKRQYLYPHKLGDGMKLSEFGSNGCGTMLCLAALLADGNGHGGGDLPAHPLIGSWAGDRIVIAGDYAEKGRFVPAECDQQQNLHRFAREAFADISWEIAEAVCQDRHFRQAFVDSYWTQEMVPPFLRDEWTTAQKQKRRNGGNAKSLRPDIIVR
jgi:hypothetical protein